jgi:hypothetical protein
LHASTSPGDNLLVQEVAVIAPDAGVLRKEKAQPRVNPLLHRNSPLFDRPVIFMPYCKNMP